MESPFVEQVPRVSAAGRLELKSDSGSRNIADEIQEENLRELVGRD